MIADSCLNVRVLGDPCYCDIAINLEEELEAPVILYYGLRNFLQDHRRFVDKWDLAQLRGEKTTDPPSLVCKPFDTVVDNDTGMWLSTLKKNTMRKMILAGTLMTQPCQAINNWLAIVYILLVIFRSRKNF